MIECIKDNCKKAVYGINRQRTIRQIHMWKMCLFTFSMTLRFFGRSLPSLNEYEDEIFFYRTTIGCQCNFYLVFSLLKTTFYHIPLYRQLDCYFRRRRSSPHHLEINNLLKNLYQIEFEFSISLIYAYS